MRALDLDFHRRRPASAAGWALLAAGVGCAVIAFLAADRIAAETAAHEATVQRIERTLPGAARAPLSAAESKAQEAVLAEMRRVVAQLNLPWDELFATLESVAVGDVALLSLTPDARKRQLRIAAEARDLAAMLAFHRRLEESGRVRDVSLVNHEIGEQAPDRPVRFNLVATWVVDDAHN
jgi:Tfp pilus assembly protein PilN